MFPGITLSRSLPGELRNGLDQPFGVRVQQGMMRSWTGPSSRMSPQYITHTRSHASRITPKSWLIKKRVFFLTDQFLRK